jgi:AraC-like DNA-binding protein
MLASEMAEQRPGSGVVVNRLTDVLLVKMIRAHVEMNPDSCLEGPWLRAIFDPKIGLALRAIHGKVDMAWTVEALASAAGMSRSAFAAHFKDLLGQPPLEYVADWRMQKAVQLLHRGKGISEAARSVGYESDAAFSKAFKRILGVTPSAYVRTRRTRQGDSNATG